MKKFDLSGKTLLLITLGSAVYAIATQFFIFPGGLLLGGTSGVSVILNHFFPAFSSGEFLMLINVGLMVLALVILGKGMAVRTFLGSLMTTFFIGFLEKAVPMNQPLISHPVAAAVIGASIVAAGSAVLFSVDSSSGGTDILALIIKKYTSLNIGKALLAADVLIVIVGAFISPALTAAASVVGLLIKTFGIDWVIALMQRKKHIE